MMAPLILPGKYVEYILARLKWTINKFTDEQPVDLLKI